MYVHFKNSMDEKSRVLLPIPLNKSLKWPTTLCGDEGPSFLTVPRCAHLYDFPILFSLLLASPCR